MRITLKAARVNAGLSQKQVAEVLKKSRMTIANWENGKTPIDSFNLIRLCELYKISLADIFLPTELAAS